MKRIILAISFISFFAYLSCSYSEEEKAQAEGLYNNVLSSVSEIVEADSAYAKCLQFLMREMQKPALKRDKEAREEVIDSSKTLLVRYENLLAIIENACVRIDTATQVDEEIDILSPAKKVCDNYKMVTAGEYSKICDQISGYKFPVNDAQYTEILGLTFEADSVLNETVSALNESMKLFAEKYELIPAEE